MRRRMEDMEKVTREMDGQEEGKAARRMKASFAGKLIDSK
jgi:hypothetical protein